MDAIDDVLARVEAALMDSQAQITTTLGGIRETTAARLWQGKVLVDWEADEAAGGCLLQPALARRLVSLHARVERQPDQVRLFAPGQIVAALSPAHADLVKRLAVSQRRSLELRIRLRFESGRYVGGDESYFVVERGARVVLLRLEAQIEPAMRQTSVHTSPAPS